MAGPVAADIGELAWLLVYAPIDEVARKEGDILKVVKIAGTRIARKYTPYQMPGLKLALQRYIWDELETWANPNAGASRRRLKQELNRRGQKQYWRVGRRSPDLSMLNPLD